MIFKNDVINRILFMMPPESMQSVQLGSRLTGETGYSSISYANARRMPANDNEVAMLGGMISDDWVTFELYQTVETTNPKVGDKITDADSVTWQIKKITVKMMRTVYSCLCLRNK